jgi:mercuric ion binding protein
MRNLILFLMLLSPMMVMAGDKEVTFKSSINCDMCKEKIEKDLVLTKGVKKVVVNVDKKEIKVTYNAEKTTEAKIKTAISKIGYDANDVIADKKAHDRLAKCCQKSEKCTH